MGERPVRKRGRDGLVPIAALPRVSPSCTRSRLSSCINIKASELQQGHVRARVRESESASLNPRGVWSSFRGSTKSKK